MLLDGRQGVMRDVMETTLQAPDVGLLWSLYIASELNIM